MRQTEHRLALLEKWNISWQGAKVLELGCGQGDCTAVLAEAVGPDGHVTAVDPAPPDYGSPYTIGEAQAHLSAGRLGPRIHWVRTDPLEFLRADDTLQYDVAVLAHSPWYFASPSLLLDTLRLLSTRAKKVCIAEWSLSSPGSPATNAHVLAVLAQAALECHKAPEETRSNVRTVLSPAQLKKVAAEAGLQVDGECTVTPARGIYDGMWEAKAVVGERFTKEVEEVVKNEREKSVVLALRDATLACISQLERGVKDVRSMDTWVCSMSPVRT